MTNVIGPLLHCELHLNVDVDPRILGVEEKDQVEATMNQLSLEFKQLVKKVNDFKAQAAPFTTKFEIQAMESVIEEIQLEPDSEAEDVSKKPE